MRNRFLNYDLENGYINNWLAAGPQEIPIDLDEFTGEDLRTEIARKHHQPDSGIEVTPVERGPLDKGLFQIGDYEGSWGYTACQDDHLIDYSKIYKTPHYLRSWAYTQLSSKTEQEVRLVLTTNGPVDLWLNGEHARHLDSFHDQKPGSTALQAQLKKGVNKVLIRFENAAWDACPYTLALRVCLPTGPDKPYPKKSGVHVTLPTLIEGLERRNTFEQVYSQAYTIQDIFRAEDHIRLYWPEDLDKPSPGAIRLQTQSGVIHAEATVDGTPGDNVFLSFPAQIPEGPYKILMMPMPWEFYEKNMRITQEIPIHILGRQQHARVPYGTYEQRRVEALNHATQQTGLYSQVARMALGKWDQVDPQAFLEALDTLGRRELLGLLGLVSRFGDHPEFPHDLLAPIEAAILTYPYGTLPTWTPEFVGFDRYGILSPAIEILAGQRYPDKTFTHTGKTGDWHRKNNRELAMAWLHHTGNYGFSPWDSPLDFEEHLLALSHLVDLAESEDLQEMSAVVMDKLFTSIAINSYRGVFGSTQGRTYAQFVKGGSLQPTSGITRLMWGTGRFNPHIAGTVSLACMGNYELPSLIGSIATSNLEAAWSRERHAIHANKFVNKVTYKTPDFMLCSAQDHQSGEPGQLEHIWQATLGPDATVFVNHPACSSESDARQPNFWVGNVSLPRVAQWKDVLIGIYLLPKDDWMGFTHAYFPAYAFDEYAIRDGWAFARVGQGYLALTASQKLELVRTGRYAFRELRSYGRGNIWTCQMGREALDGPFESFQEKVLALPLEYSREGVQFTTLRDETLTFGLQNPFSIDGSEQPLSEFMHYEHPFVGSEYPSSQLVIGYGEDLMRLNFDSSGEFDF